MRAEVPRPHNVLLQDEHRLPLAGRQLLLDQRPVVRVQRPQPLRRGAPVRLLCMHRPSLLRPICTVHRKLIVRICAVTSGQQPTSCLLALFMLTYADTCSTLSSDGWNDMCPLMAHLSRGCCGASRLSCEELQRLLVPGLVLLEGSSLLLLQRSSPLLQESELRLQLRILIGHLLHQLPLLPQLTLHVMHLGFLCAHCRNTFGKKLSGGPSVFDV